MTGPGEGAKSSLGAANPSAGGCGVKDQVSRAGAPPEAEEETQERMDLSFTGRGLQVTDEMREWAEHKFARLARLEPRVTWVELEFIAEHHPRLDGVKRVEAAFRVPRKTFRAEAEADDVPTALDRVAERLERQIRDHHGRRRKRPSRKADALESARPAPEPADTPGE